MASSSVLKKELHQTGNQDDSSSKTTATSENDKTPDRSKSPSKEQVEKWTSSINYLLSDPEGVKAFREFLKTMEDDSGEKDEYTRHIDFYMVCEEYKLEFKRLEDTAKKIFEEYLTNLQTGQPGGPDPKDVKAFGEFLKTMKDDSGEKDKYTRYIDFYMDCEKYKLEFKRLEDTAKKIFEEYLKNLQDPKGVKTFREFLKTMKDDSGEKVKYTRYIDFYLHCEEYKLEFKRLEDAPKKIFEEYLEEAADKPVDLQVGAYKKVKTVSRYLHLMRKEIADRAVLLQAGADKEVGTGGKSVAIGVKLEEEGLECVTLFDESQEKVKQKLADGSYVNFCLQLKKKLGL